MSLPTTALINSKLPDVGTSIFTVMSALANEHNAVNLGQGFPDFPMPEALIDAVDKAMRDGYNQYQPMQGNLQLRETLAEKIASLYQTSINPADEITITPGGTYALYTAMTCLLRPGDEVIVFEPAYDSYIPGIVINGAVPVRIPLQFPDYKIDWNKVRNRITPRTRMIIINNPNNPTASILREEDIQSLRDLLNSFDQQTYILSDEVYEHLVFDNLPHLSILRYPDLLSRAFVCFSFGKVYHCTGWKLGYAVAPAALMSEFRKLHQFNCFSCHSPSQIALASFLKDRDQYLSLAADMQDRRDYFLELMRPSRFSFLNSYGSYFVCAQYKAISDEGDFTFAQKLTREQKVATIPVSSFYTNGTDHKVIRFCFAKKKETLENAAERLLRV
ncbi:MAG: methionine aminotransferase [Chitinophagaceae bacterium]|nr:methionine aminotransferase [Chitinophagaceae bacterium]